MLLFSALCFIGIFSGATWYVTHIHNGHTVISNVLAPKLYKSTDNTKTDRLVRTQSFHNELESLIKNSKSDINQNHYSSALKDLFKAKKLEPQNAEIDNMIGVTYSDDQDFNKAIKFYRQAIQLNPKNSFYYSNLGDAYYSGNDSESALLTFNKAKHMNPNDSDNFYGLGRIYDDMKKYPDAIKALNHAVKLHQHGDKDSVNTLSECYQELGIAYYYSNQYTESLDVMRNVKTLNSFDYSVIGSDYYARNEFRHSLKAIRTAIKLDSHNDSAFSIAGELYEIAHKYKSATKMFLIAHRIDPSYIYYCTDACQALYYDGDLEKSESLSKAFINNFKSSPSASYLYDNLGFIAMSKDSNNKGVNYLHKAININPHDALAYDYLGDFYARHNNVSRAMNNYRNAIASDATNDQYYADLGNLYFKRHMYESAVTEYQSAMRYSDLYKLNFDPNNLMYALFKTKQPEAMNIVFNEIDYSYWTGDSYKLIGRNYYNACDYKNAVPFYRQATLLNNNDDEAFSDLGEACHKLGRNDLAIKCYQRASKLNSIDPFYEHQLNSLEHD